MLVNAIVKMLFSPEVFVGAGFLAAWVFRNKRKVMIVLLTITIVMLFIAGVSPVPLYLVKNMERQYGSLLDISSIKNDFKREHIIILGAGHTNDPALSVTSQLSNIVALRMLEGIILYKQLDSSEFIASGSPNDDNPRSQAEVVSDAAVLLGVSPEDTVYLASTENTEDEAKEYSARFGNVKDSVNVILVTSAIHMPRAVFLFNKYGINVIPAPCEFLFKEDPGNPNFMWKPSYKKFVLLDKWMDEWLGLMWTRFK